jgi:hypothetical protein
MWLNLRTLGTLNNTLTDTEYNGKLVQKGLADIQFYFDPLASETANRSGIFETKLAVEEHITRVNGAHHLLQGNADLLLDSVVQAQVGNVPQQTVSPEVLMHALREGSSRFPPDTILPFALSNDSAHAIYTGSNIQVNIRNGCLNYIVSVQLLNTGEFKVHYFVPMPFLVGRDKMIYVTPQQHKLCTDKARQYYYRSSELAIKKCKELNPLKHICKQETPYSPVYDKRNVRYSY